MPGGSPAIIAAVFRAVRTGNAFEETVERLLEGVKLGVYAPGDRLPPERELTRRLGVSRITLREALRELAAAGYVETKRGRSAARSSSARLSPWYRTSSPVPHATWAPGSTTR